MNGIKQIFGKELARIFKDKKMIFSVFLLPVLIMVLIMSIVNNMVSKMEDDIDKHEAIVYIQNEPESFRSFTKSGKFTYQIKEISSDKVRKEAESSILDGEADLIIEFPEDFDEMVQNYASGQSVPQIKTYYNPSENYSQAAYNEISLGTLETYRQQLLTERVGNLEQVTIFTVNSDNKNMVIQDDKKAGGKAVGQMIPYFVTILLFAGAMGIGADMIAGEKERGTMASLLVTPVKRSSIVLGKVFALMTISGLSSLVYVVVMIVCMPMMMSAMGGVDSSGLNVSFSMQQSIMLGALLIAIAFLYSTLIALFSVFAKSTKEASTYIMPVYMVVLIVGMMTMFSTGEPTNSSYFIPFYNNALVLQGILSQEVTMAQYGITLVETLLLGGVIIIAVAKAFKSEKVMGA